MYAHEMLLGVERGEQDRMDPEDALGAMVAALGQEGDLLGAGEDIRQSTVHNEEEMQDLGLEAQQAAVFRLHKW